MLLSQPPEQPVLPPCPSKPPPTPTPPPTSPPSPAPQPKQLFRRRKAASAKPSPASEPDPFVMPEDARIDLNPRHFRCRESLLGGSYVQKRKSRAPSKAAGSELDPDDWDAFYAPCMFTATDGSRHVELGPAIVPNEMPAPPAKRHAATAQAVPPPPPPPPSASPPTTTPPTPALSGVSPTAVPTEWPGAWPVESAGLSKTLSPGTQVRVWGLPSSVLADDGLVLNGRRGRIVGTHDLAAVRAAGLRRLDSRRPGGAVLYEVAVPHGGGRAVIPLLIRGVYLRVGPATAINALWRPRAALYRKPYFVMRRGIY